MNYFCKTCGVSFNPNNGFCRYCDPTGTEAAVCADIARRQKQGEVKYGTTVRDNPLPLKQWLRHAYEECLDQAVYLKRAIEELEK